MKVYQRKRNPYEKPLSATGIVPVTSRIPRPQTINYGKVVRVIAGSVIVIGALHRPAAAITPKKVPLGIKVVSTVTNQYRIQDKNRVIVFGRKPRPATILTGWQSIQDQLNAGYPIYIQPTPLVGTYEKVFDFGTVLNTLIINLVWDQNQIAGSTTVTSEIAYSTDGISYSSYVSARSLFVASMRYVKVRFTFTGATKHAILEFYNLVVNLNVKVETDSGSINADKDDVTGTVVLFNKTFRDINSITLTTESKEPVYTIYDFVDIPNPTSFKVLAFDSTGNRISYLVSWKARGIT